LVDGARERGLQARVYNHGTFRDLERELNRGRAIIVMTDVGGYERVGGDLKPGSPNDLDSHWMRVTKVWVDGAGQQWITFENPWGTRETMRFERFGQLWRDQRILGIPSGYDCTYILIDGPAAKPLPAATAHEIGAVMALTDGLQTLARGGHALSQGHLLRGVSRILSGMVSATFGVLGCLMAVPGTTMRRIGDTLLAHTSHQKPCSGFHLSGPLLAAAGMAVNNLGTAVSHLGNAMGAAGQTLRRVLEDSSRGVQKASRD
jgi:hypothetical protein